MDTLLDESGDLLPEYLAASPNMPTGGPPNNNGAELQYLGQFQPFTYGVSPVALGYNYYKRSQMLSRVGRQKHVQLSEQVVDNQPGLTLRVWSDEEWERGRRLEQRAFADASKDQQPRELRTSKLAPDARPADPGPIAEAIFSYDRASKAADAAIPEFNSHVERYPSSLQNFGSHIQTAYAVKHLTAADAAYLRAIVAPDPAARKAALDQAKADYREALRRYHIIVLSYYVLDADMAAIGFAREKVADMPLEQLQPLMDKFNQRVQTHYKGLENAPSGSDLAEYRENTQRIQDRLGLIK
jgi:hypothetical protein